VLHRVRWVEAAQHLSHEASFTGSSLPESAATGGWRLIRRVTGNVLAKPRFSIGL